MASEKGSIGNRYDRDKFIRAFRLAAREMVSDSYKNPDVPTGEALQEIFMQAMERKLSEMPISYYRTFEALADGKSTEELKALASGKLLDKHEGAGDRRIALLMMDMTGEYTEADFRIISPEADERYYESLFPEKSRRKISLDLTARSEPDAKEHMAKAAEPDDAENGASRKRVSIFGIHRKERTAPVAELKPRCGDKQRKKDDPIV